MNNVGADTEDFNGLPAARQCGLLLQAHKSLSQIDGYNAMLLEHPAVLAIATYATEAEKNRQLL